MRRRISLKLFILFAFCFGTIFLAESLDDYQPNNNDLCDRLIIKMLIWPCDCQPDQPNRLTCSGWFVSNRSLKKFEQHITRLLDNESLILPILKRLFNGFNQIEISDTMLTEFNIKNITNLFPITDFYFDSNRYLSKIRLGSNRLELNNFIIKNMPNVDIEE